MFWWIIGTVVVSDQLTKYLIRSTVELNQTVHVFSGLLDLTYIHNYGAAFSILQNKQTFLITFTGIAMVAIILYVIRQGNKLPRAEVAALGLIVAGGLGNLVDRVMRGYVVDFLNIYILPVFNVADMAVCAGSALLVYSVVVLEPRLRKDSSNEQ
ncbi:MAG: signal peptidase II [Bacillota bacterium]|nr:signal peptidase II [Eubacteriales bacterium]MDI9491709.1 signal peptidase II [Bacillota bacterium]NLV69423.1 signal peptidase II [Clostridiales bacterium]MDD3537239.1 signal peptidase II [Eubacteriales bacterium]MDD4285925.1 signal peptidase II [Eubacteriales bacterium]